MSRNSHWLTPLFTLMEAERQRLIIATTLSLLAAVLGLVPFLIIYNLVTILLNSVATQSALWMLSLLSVTTVIVKFFTASIATAQAHVAAYNILYELRLRLIDHLAKLPLGYFTQRSTGGIKHIINEDVEELELFIAHAIPDLVESLAVPVLTLIIMFTFYWPLALILLLTLPLSIFMALRLSKYSASKQENQSAKGYHDRLEQINGAVLEYVQGIKVVKMFNQADELLARYRRIITSHDDFMRRWILGVSFASTVLMIGIGTPIILVVGIGSVLLLKNLIPLPTLILFLMLSIGMYMPFLKVFIYGENAQFIVEATRKVLAILDEPVLLQSTQPKTPTQYQIDFHNVCFTYSQTPVLQNTSFTIPANKVTALVGTSGAGKSTIAKLIPRFWDIQYGTITIGGVNIKDIPTEKLMDSIAFVFQDVYLFNDTILNNIRMGRSSASDTEVIVAARLARCHNFIMALPNGYQTYVGERASRLSGGEKQRISLARAILKDAPIIILDEATAYADPINEVLIQQAIAVLARNKTVVIIAHRLSTIADADQIIVINKGRVTAQGTHQTLLDTDPLYASLWSAYRSSSTWAFNTHQARV